MKKRYLALVLVLLLSLLTVTAAAAEPEVGVYLRYENGVLSEPVEKTMNGFETQYEIECGVMQQVTVYYYSPSATELAAFVDDVTVTKIDDAGIYQITWNGGFQETTRGIKNGGFALVYKLPESGLYADAAYTEPVTPVSVEGTTEAYEIRYTPTDNMGEVRNYFYYSSAPITGFNVNVSGSLGVNNPNNHTVWFNGFLPDGGNHRAVVTITAGEEEKTIRVDFLMNGMEEHAIGDEERVPEAYLSQAMGPAPFTCDVDGDGKIKDETFYLGVTFVPMWERSSRMAHSGMLSHSDTCQSGMGYAASRFLKMGFWTLEANGYQPVDDETVKKILAKSSGLSLKMYADPQNQMKYPHLVQESKVYPFEKQYRFSENNNGYWYFVAEGTIDGTAVRSVSEQGWFIQKNLADISSFTTIEQINDFFRGIKAKDIPADAHNYTYIIHMKGDQFGLNDDETVIQIPAGLPEVRLMGPGTMDTQNGPVEARATVHGSLQNNGGAIVKYVDFVGDASEKHSQGLGNLAQTAADNNENCAIYGTGRTQYDYCSFTDYTIAAKCVGGFCFGGRYVTFRNNNVAYYMDLETFPGGNIWMKNFLFEGNDIAVWIEELALSELVEPWQYSIQNSIFRDNRTEFHGAQKYHMFFPGNYFEKNGSSMAKAAVVLANDGGSEGAATGSGVVTMSDGCKVSVYPVALDTGFRTFEYNASGVLSNDLTYEVPVSEISTQEYAVVEDNEAVAAYTFDSEQTEPTLVPLSMTTRNQTAPATFDPTVELTTEEDKITLVMDAMPEGKTAKVFVPCDWARAAVLEGDTEIDAEVVGGLVTFTAAKGGTYVITEAEPEEEPGEVPPTEPVQPVVPAKPGKEEEAPKADFSDVAEDAWYAEAVAFVYAEGLMNGTGGGRFQPDAPTTRAMVITMLARLADADVDESDPWYAKAVQWAVEQGISDGTMPNGSITRQQIVTMLWRSVGSPKPQGSLTGYVDADQVADYARDAMAWAVGEKIIQGIGGNRLAPTATATRAQIATIFMNLLK